MTTLFATLLMGFALSMDAFSLAIIYGTLSLPLKKMFLLSGIVGLFHFFMPIFGFTFGKSLFKLVSINPYVLIGVIFCLIAIQMFLSLNKEEEPVALTSFFSLVLFGFTVSIDSFSIGIGLSGINENIMASSLIFSLSAFIFTLMGLLLGNKLNKKFGNVSVFIGSIILFFLGIYSFFH